MKKNLLTLFLCCIIHYANGQEYFGADYQPVDFKHNKLLNSYGVLDVFGPAVRKRLADGEVRERDEYIIHTNNLTRAVNSIHFIKNYYDKNGNEIKVNKEGMGIPSVNEFNDQSQLLKSTHYYNDSIVRLQTFLYNNKNQLVEQTSKGRNGLDSANENMYYQYDKHGHIISELIYRNKVPTVTISIKYNSAGNIAFYSEYSKPGVFTRTYKYNKQHQIINDIELYPNGNFFKHSYIYNKDEMIRTETRYIRFESLVSKTQDVYDSKGYLIKTFIFKKGLRLLQQQRIFNNKHLLIEKIWQPDDDIQPLPQDYILDLRKKRIFYYYNNDGNLIAESRYSGEDFSYQTIYKYKKYDQ